MTAIRAAVGVTVSDVPAAETAVVPVALPGTTVDELCRRLHPRLVGALRLYLGDAELARELAQDTGNGRPSFCASTATSRWSTTASDPSISDPTTSTSTSTWTTTAPTTTAETSEPTTTDTTEPTATDGPVWALREDYCGRMEGDRWFGAGTWSLTAPDGSSLSGTHTSTVEMGQPGGPYTMVVEAGAGRLQGASGTCGVIVNVVPLGFGRSTQDGSITCDVVLVAGDASSSSGGSTSSEDSVPESASGRRLRWVRLSPRTGRPSWALHRETQPPS